jgi:hypothetical protein
MRTKLSWVAPLFAVTPVGTIWTAPTALAQPDEPTCTDVGGADTCESPGNIRVDVCPAAVYAPQDRYFGDDSSRPENRAPRVQIRRSGLVHLLHGRRWMSAGAYCRCGAGLSFAG